MPDEIYKDPKFWGEHYWFVMKCIAANYPDKPSSGAREKTLNFFNNLVYFLPCDTCKQHYSELIKKYPVSDKLCCGECLVSWVNKIQGKIEDIKKGRNDDNASYFDKGIKGKETKSRSKSTKSYRTASNKRDTKNRAKSGKQHYDNKIKSKYDVNHDTGNERYFQINTPTYFAGGVGAGVAANAKTINNKSNVPKGTTKFMNNKANNVNAVQNHNTKFTHQKAITFAASKPLSTHVNRKR